MADEKAGRQCAMQLYVHFPFCVRKCRYCDFLSAPGTPADRQAYLDALLSQIRQGNAAQDTCVTSIFLGGGTPSLFSGEDIAAVITQIRRQYHVSADAEITIECNPGTLDSEKLLRYRECGINRLSLGVQSFHDRELAVLGRIHTADEARRSFSLIREAGFANVNLDLMMALPGQKPRDWQETLEEAVSLAPQHISAYSLMIEEGTPFFGEYSEAERLREKGENQQLLPSEEEEREMAHRTAEILGKYGYEQYEISNYALPGYRCRHNLGYWQRAEYLGIGLGAASLLKGCRFRMTTSLAEYLRGNYAPEEMARLTREEEMEETMFLGLRLCEGVSREQFARSFGVSLEQVYGPVIRKLSADGLLEEDRERIRLTQRGMDISNTVLAMFLF